MSSEMQIMKYNNFRITNMDETSKTYQIVMAINRF